MKTLNGIGHETIKASVGTGVTVPSPQLGFPCSREQPGCLLASVP